MSQELQRLDLVWDDGNYATAAVQAVRAILTTLDAGMDDPAVARRRVTVGDALLAAFAEGAKFAAGDLLAQADEQKFPVRMGTFEIEGDGPHFLAKYGDRSPATRP